MALYIMCKHSSGKYHIQLRCHTWLDEALRSVRPLCSDISTTTPQPGTSPRWITDVKYILMILCSLLWCLYPRKFLLRQMMLLNLGQGDPPNNGFHSYVDDNICNIVGCSLYNTLAYILWVFVCHNSISSHHPTSSRHDVQKSISSLARFEPHYKTHVSKRAYHFIAIQVPKKTPLDHVVITPNKIT